jgi:penicillin-binding protein A
MIQSTEVTARDHSGSRLRRSRRLRLGAVGAVAATALVAGAVVGAGAGPAPEERLAERFTQAWERGDYERMWSLSGGPRRPRSPARFAARYRSAAATATLSGVRFGEPRDARDGVVAVPARMRTRVWGTLEATLRLPVTGEGDDARVRWHPSLAFPGLGRTERLRRETTLPERADLRFRDNVTLAAGPDRTSRYPELGPSIAGSLGPIPPERAERLRALGVPADAQVGVGGLERIFDERLLGRPGGTLFAGRRVLRASQPQAARAVRTTIAPSVQRAAVDALAGRLGGAIALDPRTGEVLGAAGIAWSGLQPPGSTFKIITAAAALEAKLVKSSTRFPVQTETTLSGVRLENANAESCGGTFLEAFAHSCNTVFAPLGARVGARRLVAAARRFGFDEPPGIPGAATSTLPDAGDIGDELAVGSTAIGQGRAEATTLQMALVSAAVANRGLRPRPTLRLGERRRPARATTPAVARTLARLMRGVVRFGTGTSAALDGQRVAGKTGTAELETTVESAGDQAPEEGAVPADDTSDTSAWFTAFAPSSPDRPPRAAVAVLLVRAGAGGATAAPAARSVLQAALRRG